VNAPDDARLVVFLRAPRAGAVKTRLAAALGEAAALAAYRTLAEATLRALAGVPGGELRFTPDDAAAEVAPWRPAGWALAPQGGGDLGARMARAVEAHRADGAGRVVMLGTDCPDVTPADVAAAWAALTACDVVLGPALDGGYWLIGLRAAARARPGWRTLFDAMPWGTPAVAEETRHRAAAAGLTLAELRPLADVDEPADWAAWRARAAGG